jgi:predicted SAM-dependent methyltransferase
VGLQATLKNFGFPYLLSRFETLSYKHYACSVCNASDRDRLYKLYIEKNLTNKKTRLVDFAPSTPLQKYLKNKNNIIYRSADLMMPNVDDKIDITDMKQYADESFDFFICSHIIEHVTDDSKALKELHRILKKDGSGILMTPIINKKGVFDEDVSVTDVAERWRRFAQDDHVRLYEKKIFIKRVQETGFIIEQHGYMSLGLFNFIRNGIRLKSKLYIVRRLNDNES